MTVSTSVKVSKRYQIAVPAIARELLNIKSGDRLLVDIQDGIIVRPLSLNRSDIARKFEALLSNFPNLKIVELDRDVIRQAAQLRVEYRIGSPDVLQTGAGLIHGAGAFITNDRRLERLRDKLDVIILDDFIEND